MKHKNLLFTVANRLFLAIAILSSIVFNTNAQITMRFYTVGNSVTDQVNFAGFDALCESRGNTHIYGRHMIPGAPLSWLWTHMSDGFTESPFGAPNNAFPNYNWDAISLQPFDRQIDGTEGDLAMIQNYVNIAKNRSPNVQFYIYMRWPRTPNSKLPTDATLTADTWNSLYTQTWSPSVFNSNESKDYFQRLLTAVRNGTSLNKPFLIIPVGEVMYQLNNKMKNGQVSGYNEIWQVYRDGIHLNNVGSYIVACTFYSTVYKADPRGLTVPSQYATISSSLATIIQNTVWEVVSTYPYSGVGSGVAVTGVTVSPTSATITVGGVRQLTATVSPSNATNKGVTWSSSNTTAATVDANGLVTARAAGTATITVRTSDGGRTATSSITVVASSGGVAVTGVTVSPTSATTNPGKTVQLTPTVAPSNATNKNVTWSSSNTSVATVNASGNVSAVAVGTATITVRTDDGGRTATSSITVVANRAPTAVLNATPLSGAAPLNVSFNANGSSDPDPGDYILGYDWNFGDGSANSNANAPSHTYNTPGTYTVSLRVMDNNNLYSTAVTRTITVTSGGGTAVNLFTWNFASTGGQTTKAYATVATGVSTAAPSGVTSFGAGLTATNYLTNGFTANRAQSTTLGTAISNNDYIAFTVTPASGKSVSVTQIKLRPVSQNRTRTFVLMSSKNGFTSSSTQLGSFVGGMNSGAALQTINVSNHANLTTATQFRVYIFGFDNQFENVGIGNKPAGSTEADLYVIGTVQNAAREATDEVSSTGIVLYPNPTEGIINIQFPDSKEVKASVSVVDILGNTVLTQSVNLSDGVLQSFNLSSLPKGLYIVQVKIGGESYLTKVNLQ